jgi:transposase InsO family protein
MKLRISVSPKFCGPASIGTIDLIKVVRERCNLGLQQGGRFHDEHDARIELFSYIDGYYNTRRKHSSINYLSPIQFESNFHKN